MKKLITLSLVFMTGLLLSQKAQIDLPITWNDTANVDYTITDFGGNTSSVVVDPTNSANLVLQSVKDSTAQLWAGTTLSTPSGLATAIPFAPGSTTISVAVWSPDAGIPVRLKAEDHTDPTKSVETEALTTQAGTWETLTFDFTNQAAGTAAINYTYTYDMLSIFFNFGTDGATAGNKTYYCDDITFGSGSGPSKAQISLPITWNDTTNVDYTVTDFGGNTSTVVVDPTDPTNLVLESVKGGAAQTWAGTTLSTPAGLATAIPFAPGSTSIDIAIWSPDANIPVRLKAEDATDPTKSVETETMTMVAGAWDTLTFDFSNQVSGTAAINFTYTYNMLSIFYNFGTDGATAGSKTYYCDNVMFSMGGGATKAQIDLPITWNDTANVDYTVTDFGGNTSTVVVDPTDPTNLVLESVKGGAAQTWAGTTLSTPAGLANAIPFAPGSTSIDIAIWSPDAGIPVRLKVEDATDPTRSVETETMTMVAGAWDTLTFDFSNQVSGTAAINFSYTYNMISIFYNFGTDGATAGSKTYYCDNVMFSMGGGGPVKAPIGLPITWDDTANVDYTIIDFGGNASTLTTDPVNASNLVLQSIKTAGAQTWAGTSLGNALDSAIPFSAGNTVIKALVYSPVSGIPVRIKVEDQTNAAISVETEAMTMVAGAWDTLTFDFANQAAGTAAINFANTYDKASIFYDFGTAGAADTFYVDWIDFVPAGSSGPTKAPIGLPITWDDTANVDYTVIDFGGNASTLTTDPVNASNLVLQSIKTAGSQTWAGTSLGNALDSAIPFSAGNTVIKALVYSPASGLPVRVKVEDQNDPTISVETEVQTAVAGAWDTLTFDFANQVAGTSAINFANTYDKASIFYDFGTAGAADTFYVDWIDFVPAGSSGPTKAPIGLPITWDDTANVDYTVIDFGGNASTLTTDPVNASNLVLQSIKTAGAQTWAGTSLGNALDSAIPFSAGNTVIKALVYSPVSGIPVRIKVEDQTNAAISVETEAMTMVAGAWDTLTFDFANQAAGTAAINFANTYDKASIFYDFGTAGAADTFYVDWIDFVPAGSSGPTKAPIGLPITWDDTANVDYTVIDFGGNASTLTTDPVNASNLVLQSIKTAGAQTWAGTSLGNALDSAIPFSAGNTVIKALVYSPASGLPVRVKVEDQNDPTISVETEVQTAVAGAWDTLTFDFANQVAGTSAINFANTYDKASIFYDFGTAGTADTFYVDWIDFVPVGSTGPSKAPIGLPITWDDTANVDYTVIDFGGNASMLTQDPMNASNLVLQSIKTAGSQTWAGTTFGNALDSAIPFSPGNTIIKALVYAPAAGLPVRLKVEDQNDPTKSVETEALTTVAGAWDTLSFDFINPVTGTAAIDFSYTYDKMSIFYDFGTAGAADTFYVDYVDFTGGGGSAPTFRNITFQVDLSQYTGTYTQVNLNGTFNGWCGSCAVMTDANNDSIYEITVNVTSDTIEYKFTLDGWTVDEQFAGGEPCTKTVGGFTNRFLAPSGDTTLPAVCWESCAPCGGAVPTRNVTFQVDLSTYTGSYTEVNLNGTFNGWCGSCAVMTDANNDSIYEITVNVPTDTIQYKFTLDGWTVDEQFAGGEPCTYTDGGFTNRYLAPTGDTTLNVVCWESCDPCDIGLEDQDWVDLRVAPNPTSGMVNIRGNLRWDSEYQLIITDITGRRLLNIQRRNNEVQEQIDLSQYDNGTYLLTILGKSGKLTERLILQR